MSEVVINQKTQNGSGLWKKIKKTGSKFLLVLIFVFSKFKWLVGVLKLAKFGSLISMVFSLVVYGWVYGWMFGVAIIYNLFVHEYGHLLAAKSKGIKTSPAVFIPFVGALIGLKEQPKDAKTESYVAFAGPLFGLVFAVIPSFVLYHVTGSGFWALSFAMGAMLNLFNLFPVSPLDGGRIVSVLSTKIWAIGLVVMIPLAVLSHDSMLGLISLFGFLTWFSRLREGYKLKCHEIKLETLKNYEALYLLNKNLPIDFWKNSEGLSLIEQVEKRQNGYIKSREWMGKASSMHSVATECAGKIKDTPKFNLPFIHDARTLKREEYKAKYDALHILSSSCVDVSRALVNENFNEIPNRFTSHIEEVEKQINALNSYYKSSWKDKAVVLVAYVILAVCLSYFWVNGTGIIEAYKASR